MSTASVLRMVSFLFLDVHGEEFHGVEDFVDGEGRDGWVRWRCGWRRKMGSGVREEAVVEILGEGDVGGEAALEVGFVSAARARVMRRGGGGGVALGDEVVEVGSVGFALGGSPVSGCAVSPTFGAVSCCEGVVLGADSL